jgi:septum formation protein
MPPPASSRLVLASTSAYRKALLARLQIPFEVATPDVDETPLEGEAPDALALRLARSKAYAVRHRWPDAWIIGSDQVAVVGNTILHKPGNFETAFSQLKQMSGKAVHFYTALCLLNARTSRVQDALVPVVVHMRSYHDAEIERYLRAEQPYDCAGSARIEGLGITLVRKLKGDDPNALIGLPLIALCAMLRNEGWDLP